jgi:hypothetical protein
VLGKPNFPDTLTLCRFCHGYPCDHQRAWLLCRRDKRTKLSCFFFGWADVFDLISNRSGQLCFQRLASRFRAQGWHIRNNRKAKQRTHLENAIIA